MEVEPEGPISPMITLRLPADFEIYLYNIYLNKIKSSSCLN